MLKVDWDCLKLFEKLASHVQCIGAATAQVRTLPTFGNLNMDPLNIV